MANGGSFPVYSSIVLLSECVGGRQEVRNGDCRCSSSSAGLIREPDTSVLSGKNPFLSGDVILACMITHSDLRPILGGS